ncbi:uncharacterized protein PAC_15654 [Phialocephala subalpina]|uniref:F-box domain-containing protein n=1 Tax=Phialocephala subalpina TaxID=576137 RepID=A0A1L7XL67_9HELO|nr:uncharacterized protein PAC_15654 [Phialocephala subalpina]
MLLHDLDEDVLGIVVSLLSSDRKDVVNLALTCHALCAAARRPEHVSITSPSTRLALTRSCIEDPTFGHRARSLYLKINGKRTISRYTVFEFFRRMPNLQSLTLDADVKPHFMPVLLSDALSLRNNLRHLHVTDSTLTVNDLWALFALPRLRYLEISSRREIAFSSLDPTPDQLFPLRHLRMFDLGSDSYLQPDLLEEILIHCPKLETLECNIALPLVTQAPAQGPWLHPFYPRPRHYNSPERLLTTLLHAPRTLVNLSLFTNGLNGVVHDGSRLDLSSFVNLTNLTASADLFIAPVGSNVARDGLYRLLPRNIESFTSANQKSSQLLFGANTGIFYNVSHRRIDEDTRKRFLEQGPDESMSRWITEIVENKEACFPGLRRVELREILKEVARPHWRAVEERWAFEKAGVELEIWIRDDEKLQPWIPRMHPR